MANSSDVGRPVLRRDAEANRQRILEAAFEAFGNEGLGVSMVEIARRAGVGNATVHRNFACKQQLLDELFKNWFARRQAAAEVALANPDPWLGLVGFIEDTFADGEGHRAAGELYALRMQGRQRLIAVLRKLMVRAQAAGAMRSDVTAQDMTMLMLGIGRTIEVTGDVAPQQWRRHLGIVLDGLRAETDVRLPGKPIEARLLEETIRAFAQPLVGRDVAVLKPC